MIYCDFFAEMLDKVRSENLQAYFATCYDDRFYHIENADELIKLQRTQCQLCDIVDCEQKKKKTLNKLLIDEIFLVL